MEFQALRLHYNRRSERSPYLKRVEALTFANQLRCAREIALKDAEAFDAIIHAIEGLGSFLTGKILDLGKYKKELEKLSSNSALAEDLPKEYRVFLTFSQLYELVRVARNDALHQGAFARHLTNHAIQLALILEDALRNYHEQEDDPATQCVSDYMVRNPICAELWQPLGFIRQEMLINSFSFLPVSERKCHLISDRAIAAYLRADESKWRKRRLAITLGNAIEESGIELTKAECLNERDTVAFAIGLLRDTPLLVRRKTDPEMLVGIVTAFDLL